MTISTLDGVIAARLPPQPYSKAASGTLVTGRPFTPFYTAGVPGAAIAPSPGLPGAALTSYAGQIPFPAAVGGKSVYLDRFSGVSTGSSGILMVCDRLWHNSGLTITSTAAQTITSAAWPARDRNAATNGDGVYIGVEVVTTTGAGTPTFSMSYTNQAGTSGQTGTSIDAGVATSATGSFHRMGLAAGDTGVQSIQNFTLSASWTSGSISLVAYRVLSMMELSSANVSNAVDAISGSLPICYDNTVPFLIFVPSTTTTSALSGLCTFAQG